MKPVNNKSMISFIFNQMDKLDKGEINVETAREQANLSKQVNNAMKYELDRAKMKIKLREHNHEYKDDISLREIEGSNF